MIYPDDFNKHEDSVDVDDDGINRLIQDAITTLMGNDETPDVEIATGNTIVQAIRIHPDDTDEKCVEEYEIRVIKNYHTCKLYR
jgi:hypothetical protein